MEVGGPPLHPFVLHAAVVLGPVLAQLVLSADAGARAVWALAR